MEQWTYLVLDLKRLSAHTEQKIGKHMISGAPKTEDAQKALQVLGADGWELVHVIQTEQMSGPHYYFKRRVRHGESVTTEN